LSLDDGGSGGLSSVDDSGGGDALLGRFGVPLPGGAARNALDPAPAMLSVFPLTGEDPDPPRVGFVRGRILLL